MANKKLKPIPVFATEDEERIFWGSHDSTEYVDWSGALREVRFPNLKPTTRSISVRLPEALIVELKVQANKMDVPYQSLLKVYLADRVNEERVKYAGK